MTLSASRVCGWLPIPIRRVPDPGGAAEPDGAPALDFEGGAELPPHAARRPDEERASAPAPAARRNWRRLRWLEKPRAARGGSGSVIGFLRGWKTAGGEARVG